MNELNAQGVFDYNFFHCILRKYNPADSTSLMEINAGYREEIEKFKSIGNTIQNSCIIDIRELQFV